MQTYSLKLNMQADMGKKEKREGEDVRGRKIEFLCLWMGSPSFLIHLVDETIKPRTYRIAKGS